MRQRTRDLACTDAFTSGSGQAARAEGPVALARSGIVGLALFVSALQASLAAGSAVGGVIYDARGPGGALALAAAVAAAGSLALLGRAGAAINSSPAGSADLDRERGPDVPTPSPGAIETAGNRAQQAR